MSRNIYVASSWKNPYQQGIVRLLREEGNYVYDFKKPPGRTGFAWQEISDDWETWTAKEYVRNLASPMAESGYQSDFKAMMAADTCVLVLPSGRSAHLEAGFMVGQGKRTAILTQDGEPPELMAKMADTICTTIPELTAWLRTLAPSMPRLLAAE